MSKINGTFISRWDDGSELHSPAILHLDTGEIEVLKFYDDSPKGAFLDEEEFVGEDGKSYAVCPICHNFILKTEIVEGVGKHLYEETYCMDENCGYAGVNYVKK